MQLNINELRQQRAKIVAEMRVLQDRIDETSTETPEDSEKFQKMEKDCRALERRIEREETLQEEEGKLAKLIDDKRKTVEPGLRMEEIRYPKMGLTRPASRFEMEQRACNLIQGWLRCVKPGMEIREEHHEAAKHFGVNLQQKEIELPITKHYRMLRHELRDLNITNATKGQETIPEGFVNSLEVALLSFGGMRANAEILRTEMGNDLPWPTTNDTSNKAVILDEATDFTTSLDPSFGVVVFKAFKYSTRPVLISSEMLQDSAFDLGARIGEMLGDRIGRGQNDHFTTGGGTTLPKGIMVAGSLGKLATSDTTFTADEVIDLEHSVDPAYRPNASFMMHDQVLAQVRKLKEQTTSAYIWQPGLQAGVPDRLLGYRYTINQSMSSTFEADEKLLAFGDFSKYKIRDVASIRLKRLDELYAATDQVAFIAYMRSDGNLVDAGTNPVKYLQLAPS